MNVEHAYGEAIFALLDATPPQASERFDHELAAAVDAGLDPVTARTLRWWQRESVRAVRDHAAAVLPPLIGALVTSQSAPGRAGNAPAEQIGAAPSLTLEPSPPEPHDVPAAVEHHDGEESRRRTLVAGLLALPDAASA